MLYNGLAVEILCNCDLNVCRGCEVNKQCRAAKKEGCMCNLRRIKGIACTSCKEDIMQEQAAKAENSSYHVAVAVKKIVRTSNLQRNKKFA